MEAPSSGKGGMPDFTFGFNDACFSDRTLLLEIVDEVESVDEFEVGNVDEVESDDLEPNTKRRRCVDLTKEPRVKTVHISTLILASRSSFFHKLFTNGMQESLQKDITLRIDASEEGSFMDLMKYLYSNNLPTDLNALLHLCVIADKFEVVSCLRECFQSLQSLPMTCESASIYLDLPQSLLMLSTIQQLVDAAKKFLIAKFKDFHKVKEEMLSQPLASIKEVLGCDDLQVTSECDVYDFVLTWARRHYPNLEERRGILKTHLLGLIRFPFMTTTKLAEEVQTCIDIDPEVSSKIVNHAIRFRAETPLQKLRLAAEDQVKTASRQFVERANKFQPVLVVELGQLPLQRVVYLHFTKEKIKQMVFPGGQIQSETFDFGGQEFVLLGETAVDAYGYKYLMLVLKVLGSATVEVNYEIQLRKKGYNYFQSQMMGLENNFQSGMRKQPHGHVVYKFESCAKGSHKFTESKRTKPLHSLNWNALSDHSTCGFFIDNVLNVRVELTIMK